jgi:hypothetical protein
VLYNMLPAWDAHTGLIGALHGGMVAAFLYAEHVVDKE